MQDRQPSGGEPSSEPGGRVVGLVLAVLAMVALLTAALVYGPAAAPGVGGPQSQDSDRSAPAPEQSAQWAAVGDVANGSSVVISYATERGARQFAVDGVDSRYVDARHNWAIIDRGVLPDALARMDGNESAGVVVVGEHALVGTLTSATVRLQNATLTVVAPAGLGIDPTRKAAFLDRFLSPYRLLDDRNVTVTLVGVPRSLPARGLAYGDTAYVASRYFWDGDVGSVWIHETVHTHQRFELAREMEWFEEASAEYLSYRIMQEQYGEVTNADVRARLDALERHPDSRLAAPSTWAGESVDYRRGARLLYAVDAAIRAGSDGRRSLVDVFRTMNRREDPVTVAAFVRLVERHSGRDADWVRRAITGSGPLDQYVGDVRHDVFRR